MSLANHLSSFQISQHALSTQTQRLVVHNKHNCVNEDLLMLMLCSQFPEGFTQTLIDEHTQNLNE